ncbi:ubiquitin-conjugating enzyme E2 J1-like [Parasteatoda tepidariorum]|uniref:ubiquitin-conjugating enzyme E2 J1-like n=1 Tax=Parasteatoda tepidariorum TaxID=114398 RepID=UPI0039BCA5EC
MREAEELRYPTSEYHAQPLEDNLFEWHFTLSGPPNTEFEGGIYHGRITLPPDYPMKPPSIILLTPNGRFETNKKICLSISGYHPESWQPSWSIRTALLAIIGFLPTHGNGAIGSLDYTPEERKELALKSRNWKCPQCGNIKQHLAEKSCDTTENHKFLENEEPTIKDEKSPLTTECTNSAMSETFPSNVTKPAVSTKNPDLTENNNFSVDVATTSAVPSIGLPTENILRHRQNVSELENSAVTVQTSVTRPMSNNWSSTLMWVIVILLGILILRRIICQ